MCHWLMLYHHLGQLDNHTAFTGHAPVSKYHMNDATNETRHDAL